MFLWHTERSNFYDLKIALEKAFGLVLALLKQPSFELYHNNLTPKHSLQFKTLSLFDLDTKLCTQVDRENKPSFQSCYLKDER